MSEQDLNNAMDHLSESVRRAVQRELRRSIQSPSDVLALLRADRAREAAYTAWPDEAGPAIYAELTTCAELTAELILADLRAAGTSGWDAVDDALMYGAGNPPDPWCSDATCAHADVRHKHTRLFRKPCVMAEDGTILETER